MSEEEGSPGRRHARANLPASPEAPGRTGLGMASGTGRWQVFGLASFPASTGFLLSVASQDRAVPVLLTEVVLADRCGAAPDSHRVPFSGRAKPATSTGTSYGGGAAGVKPWGGRRGSSKAEGGQVPSHAEGAGPPQPRWRLQLASRGERPFCLRPPC